MLRKVTREADILLMSSQKDIHEGLSNFTFTQKNVSCGTLDLLIFTKEPERIYLLIGPQIYADIFVRPSVQQKKLIILPSPSLSLSSSASLWLLPPSLFPHSHPPPSPLSPSSSSLPFTAPPSTTLPLLPQPLSPSSLNLPSPLHETSLVGCTFLAFRHVFLYV